MTKVLLASPYTPNDLGWGEDMDDLFSCRLSRAQGAFTLHGHLNYWALHLIAENINAHTTVLEYAHLDEFEDELRRGSYDFVGLQIKGLQTQKVARMVESIRRLSPRSKIILGGYGILGLDTPMPSDKGGEVASYILSNVDYVCREEGVRFFRRVIGDEPIDRPIRQYHLPSAKVTMNGVEDFMDIDFTCTLAALGCPNGCEFCMTSAFFKRKKVQVAEPYEVFSFMKHFAKGIVNKPMALPIYLIFDEDFLLDKEYVRELGRLLAADDEACLVRYVCFASLKAIEQYDGPDELAHLGLWIPWIGVESFEDELITSDHKIEKRSCSNIENIVGGLYDHGIANILSFIIGWDFHTPQNIMADVERFIGLKPVFYQIAPLSPCPGTVLYDRLKKSGRIRDEYDYKDIHIWCDEAFQQNHFDKGQIEQVFHEAHQKLYGANGSSILGIIETGMNFYERYKDSPRHYMVRRAERLAEGLNKIGAVLPAMVSQAQGEQARERAIKIQERHRRIFGERTFVQRVVSGIFENVVKEQQQLWDSGKRVVVSDQPWLRSVFEPGRPPVRVQGPPRLHQLPERKRRKIEQNLRKAEGGGRSAQPAPKKSRRRASGDGAAKIEIKVQKDRLPESGEPLHS